MSRVFFLMIFLLQGLSCTARDSPAAEPSRDAELRSPDGRLALKLVEGSRAPTYSVRYDDIEVIRPSRLGLRFSDDPDLVEGLAIGSIERSSADQEWEQPWGERRFVQDQYNEMTVTLHRPPSESAVLVVRIRLYDDGLGFRYEVPDNDDQDGFEIIDEITEFALGDVDKVWWIPAGGWNRYEYIYNTTGLDQVERAHTPLTARLKSGVHLAIHEAALVDYAGMWLNHRRPNTVAADLAPWPDGIKVKTDGSFNTPWRTIQIASTATGLINSDLILNLNEPNKLGDVSFVKPSKYVGIWWCMHIKKCTWGSGPNHGATTARTIKYIDFAAEHGFDGVLVEGWNRGWDGDWFSNGDVFSFTESYPDFDLESLAEYARGKGVRLIGHHETSGSLSNYESQMEQAFDLYERLGITQVKTGYVADGGDLKWIDENGKARFGWHDGQYSVNHHTRVLESAARRGISINAHEPVKDTGLRRTYPNWITREGARGQEFNAWGDPPNPPEHTTILPFTRMLSGPMDFTPGIFDLRPNGEDHPSRIETTLAKQLALYVIIYSPLQMAADLPENYEANLEAFQFIKDVPVDWEESIALRGEIGDYLVIARQRRNGDDWYVGAVTDEEKRTLDIELSFLESGQEYQAEIYRDGEDAHWEAAPYLFTKDVVRVTREDVLTVLLAPGGGAAVRLVPAESR